MSTNKNRTNIFSILNSNLLSGEYRLFEIRGLEIDSKDYQRDKQHIIRSLSRELKHPIEIIKRGKKPFLVTKNEKDILEIIPKEYSALRNKTLYFEITETVFPLDFNSSSVSDRAICQRFLQFSIQGSLFNNKKVWQPSPGKPFFSKNPKFIRDVDVYPGFIIRVIDLKENGWGLSIDATRKYLKADPLPTYLTKQEFDRNYKGRTVVYKLGDQWYEIKLNQWHGLNVSKHKYEHPSSKGITTLLADLRNRCSKPHPELLANLPADASVVLYYLSNGEERSVPSGLCFLVLGTEDEMDGHLHQNSILAPTIRLDEIYEIRDKVINNLRFGQKQITLDKNLLEIPKNKFLFPDIIAGDNVPIRFSDSKSKPKAFAKSRANKVLNDRNFGFLKPTQISLGEQFIFLPRSVYDTCKDDFVNRIIDDVNPMYPWSEYNPKVYYFEDVPTKRNNYVGLGRKIVVDIKEKLALDISGHALVMIPNTIKGKREHDKLGALIIRELKEFELTASVIHSSIVKECYEEKRDRDGEIFYAPKRDKKGKLRGYTRNVALIKVLLNNRKYPFAFDTPLNADLTVGIDVKNNLAGFIYIDKYAQNIHPEFVKTTHKEKLPDRIIAKQLYDSIKMEAQDRELKNIVLQRDGRIFDTELRGIALAMKKLKSDEILPKDATISIIEIPKSSFLSFRLFDSSGNFRREGPNALNPEIGSYHLLNDEIAYVCTTGKEFLRKGTSKPLMVKFISGKMPFQKILQDVFSLSTLTFTKLDDCSRIPFTIKILDIMLRNFASDYDKEKYDFSEFEDFEMPKILKEEINLN